MFQSIEFVEWFSKFSAGDGWMFRYLLTDDQFGKATGLAYSPGSYERTSFAHDSHVPILIEYGKRSLPIYGALTLHMLEVGRRHNISLPTLFRDFDRSGVPQFLESWRTIDQAKILRLATFS